MNYEEKIDSLEKIDEIYKSLCDELKKWGDVPQEEYFVANDLSGGWIELDEAKAKLERLSGDS